MYKCIRVWFSHNFVFQFTTNHEQLNSAQFNFINFIWNLNWLIFHFLRWFSYLCVCYGKKWCDDRLVCKFAIEFCELRVNTLLGSDIWVTALFDVIMEKGFQAPSFYHITEYITFRKTNICTGYRTGCNIGLMKLLDYTKIIRVPNAESEISILLNASIYRLNFVSTFDFDGFRWFLFSSTIKGCWCWWYDSQCLITRNFEIHITSHAHRTFDTNRDQCRRIKRWTKENSRTEKFNSIHRRIVNYFNKAMPSLDPRVQNEGV